MCFRISVRYGQQKVNFATLARWLNPLLLSFVLLALPYNGFSQDSGGTDIRTIDMRGQDPLMATAKSVIESRNDVVVVLVKGAGEELIEKAKGQLKALTHLGYDRLGVILCDFRPGETLVVIGIVSDGTMYATIKGAQPDARTMSDLYGFVKDAYEDNIIPKLEQAGSKGN